MTRLAPRCHPPPHVPNLRKLVGTSTQNPDLVLCEFYAYYEKLYDGRNDTGQPEFDDLVDRLSIPTLTDIETS